MKSRALTKRRIYTPVELGLPDSGFGYLNFDRLLTGEGVVAPKGAAYPSLLRKRHGGEWTTESQDAETMIVWCIRRD